MIIEVVARQVRKGGGGERHAPHPLLLECMRRDLHGTGGIASFHHAAEIAVQINCFCRRSHRRLTHAPNPSFDGAEQSYLLTGGRQDRVLEVRRGGLAIRSGDGQHAKAT